MVDIIIINVDIKIVVVLCRLNLFSRYFFPFLSNIQVVA